MTKSKTTDKKVTITLSPEMHKKLKIAAISSGLTLSLYVEKLFKDLDVAPTKEK